MCIVIIGGVACGIINFEIKLGVLVKPFFYIPKSQDKIVNISRTKRGFNIK